MARVDKRVDELDVSVIRELSFHLNPYIIMKDVQALAGKMGYRWLEARNFKESFRNPTAALLEDWCRQKTDRTVIELINLLQAIERFDCVEILEPHKYSYIKTSLEETYLANKPMVVSESVKTGRPCELVDLPKAKAETSSHEGRKSCGVLSNGTKTPCAASLPCENEFGSEADVVVADQYLEHYAHQFVNGNISGDIQGSSHRILSTSNASQNHVLDDQSLGQSYLPRSPQTPDTAMGAAAPVADLFARGFGQRRVKAQDGNVPHDMIQQLHRNGGLSVQSGRNDKMSSGNLRICNGPVIPRDKVALAIGNKDYQEEIFQGLKLPENDACFVAEALTELGFKVISLVNLTLEEMRTAMLAYSKLLGPGVFGVLYYSGHGCEEAGENYLLPVDMPAKFVSNRAIRAQEFLQEMQNRDTAMNLLIVDACRIRIRSTEDEKTSLKRTPKGNTIFAYACMTQQSAYENQRQKTGEYCRILLQHIRRDTRVEHIFMDINKAVAESGISAQRSNFESDAYQECRLTSPVALSVPNDEFLERTRLWRSGQRIPADLLLNRERYDLEVCFTSLINNTLDVSIFLHNLDPFDDVVDSLPNPSTFTPVQLVYSEVKINPILPSTKGLIAKFRMECLQKVKVPVVAVISFLIEWSDGSTEDDYLKLDLGFPCVSAIFSQFADWITGENPHWTSV